MFFSRKQGEFKVLTICWGELKSCCNMLYIMLFLFYVLYTHDMYCIQYANMKPIRQTQVISTQIADSSSLSSSLQKHFHPFFQTFFVFSQWKGATKTASFRPNLQVMASRSKLKSLLKNRVKHLIQVGDTGRNRSEGLGECHTTPPKVGM